MHFGIVEIVIYSPINTCLRNRQTVFLRLTEMYVLSPMTFHDALPIHNATKRQVSKKRNDTTKTRENHKCRTCNAMCE